MIDIISGRSTRRRFLCDACGYVYESESEAESFLSARQGDYFPTVVGYFSGCTRCASYARECKKLLVREPHKEYTGPVWDEKKEAPTMQVEYNGFTGELVKLEHVKTERNYSQFSGGITWSYNLSIYASDKQVTHSFTSVKLEDIKFLGGAVSFE